MKNSDSIKFKMAPYRPLFLFERGPGCDNLVLSDLSVCWCFSKCNKSLRYEGVPMNSALYVKRFSLNLIRDLIGRPNQFSDLSQRQRLRVAAARDGTRRGGQYPFGPNGPRGKNGGCIEFEGQIKVIKQLSPRRAAYILYSTRSAAASYLFSK